jgi:hypothetical protein
MAIRASSGYCYKISAYEKIVSHTFRSQMFLGFPPLQLLNFLFGWQKYNYIINSKIPVCTESCTKLEFGGVI